jgi:UDP-3-O-[3-hydroxymyristoyl] glucosamine N-acyltransferase
VAWTVAGIAQRLGLEVRGDGQRALTRVAPLGSATADCLAFIARAGMADALACTAAGAVIVDRESCDQAPTTVLIADNPYAAYARAARLLHPGEPGPDGVDASASVAATAKLAGDVRVGAHAVIEADAEIGAGAVVEAGAVVGRGSQVGPGSRLGGNSVLRHACVIGGDCRVQPGAVIGADGFGFARDGDEWIPIPQLGRVVVGDGVHVGANTTIDRGALEDTVIGDGVILDNQIQIGHNVRVGAGTAMAGCVGVAGSAVIGRRCAIGGGAGILGHLAIADDVQVTAMSLVHKSITLPGTYSSGVPLESNAEWRRNAARFRQLDRIARRVSRLEAFTSGAAAAPRREDDES